MKSSALRGRFVECTMPHHDRIPARKGTRTRRISGQLWSFDRLSDVLTPACSVTCGLNDIVSTNPAPRSSRERLECDKVNAAEACRRLADDDGRLSSCRRSLLGKLAAMVRMCAPNHFEGGAEGRASVVPRLFRSNR